MTIMINGRRRDSRKRTDFSLSNLLTSTIGRGHRSSENDILNMRQRFRALGLDSGYAQDAYLDRKLDGAIRRFQLAHDLKEDGVMRPGGETERMLTHKLHDKGNFSFERRVPNREAPTSRKKPKSPQPTRKPPPFDPMNGQAINVSPGMDDLVGLGAGGAARILRGTENILKDTALGQAANNAAKKIYNKIKDTFDSEE